MRAKRISLLAVAHRFSVLRPEWCQKWCQMSSLWAGDTISIALPLLMYRSTSSQKFANSEKRISRLPLPPPVRRRRPHLASSPGPCATPPPMLPLSCLSAQLIFERQPRRGSRCLLEYPLFRVRHALLPTAAPPAPFLPVLQPRRQIPPRPFGLRGSVRRPMRGRGFLCRDQQPCRDRPGARLSTPGCKDQERRLV